MKDWARRSVLVVSAYIDRRSCSNECFLHQCKLCSRASTKLTSTCLSPGWAVEMPRVKCCICGTYSGSNFRSSAGWNKPVSPFFFLVGVVEAKFTNTCMHVPKILHDTHILILWNGAAAYPTPKLKINNWENVKIQDIVYWKKCPCTETIWALKIIATPSQKNCRNSHISTS